MTKVFLLEPAMRCGLPRTLTLRCGIDHEMIAKDEVQRFLYADVAGRLEKRNAKAGLVEVKSPLLSAPWLSRISNRSTLLVVVSMENDLHWSLFRVTDWSLVADGSIADADPLSVDIEVTGERFALGFHSPSGYFASVFQETGLELFTRAFGPDDERWGVQYLPVALDSERSRVVVGGASLHCVGFDSGLPIWEKECQTRHVALGPDALLYCSGESEVVCRNIETGERCARQETRVFSPTITYLRSRNLLAIYGPTAGRNGSLVIWDADLSRVQREWKYVNEWPRSAEEGFAANQIIVLTNQDRFHLETLT